jgi:predicted helicase
MDIHMASYDLSHLNDYKRGNRSSFDWVIDQFQINTDKRSGISNAYNGYDDPKCILRLIKRVAMVSVATVNVAALLGTTV